MHSHSEVVCFFLTGNDYLPCTSIFFVSDGFRDIFEGLVSETKTSPIHNRERLEIQIWGETTEGKIINTDKFTLEPQNITPTGKHNDRTSMAYPEIVPLKALIACNTINWQGDAVISFYTKTSPWLTLYTLVVLHCECAMKQN